MANVPVESGSPLSRTAAASGGVLPVVLVNYRFSTALSEVMTSFDRILGMRNTSGPASCQLYPAAGLIPGTLVVVKDESLNASHNPIVISATAPDTIDSFATVTIGADGGAAIMYVNDHGYSTMPGGVNSVTPPVQGGGPIPKPPPPVVTAR